MNFPLTVKFLKEVTDLDFKKELEQLLGLVQNGFQQVKKVIGKIMKFDQKVTVPADTTINIIEFYTEGRDDIKLSIGSNFKQVVDEATENGKHAIVDISGEIISQYKNKQSENDYNIMADMQEPFLAMQDDGGRSEMRKRLAIAAYCMQQQPKGKEGILQTNGNVTVIGYPLLMSGSEWRALVYRHGDVWRCSANGHLGYAWDAEPSFWSRNDA